MGLRLQVGKEYVSRAGDKYLVKREMAISQVGGGQRMGYYTVDGGMSWWEDGTRWSNAQDRDDLLYEIAPLSGAQLFYAGFPVVPNGLIHPGTSHSQSGQWQHSGYLNPDDGAHIDLPPGTTVHWPKAEPECRCSFIGMGHDPGCAYIAAKAV